MYLFEVVFKQYSISDGIFVKKSVPLKYKQCNPQA